MRVDTLIGNGTRGQAQAGSYTAETVINEPFGVTIGPEGQLYFCDVGSHRVLSLDMNSHTLSVVAGTGESGYAGDGGQAVDALCIEPYEIRFDAAGNLYFVDMPAHVVRRIDTSGVITTIAGTGEQGFSGDRDAATDAMLSQPHAIEITPDERHLLICDIGNHRVRRVDLQSGQIDTWLGTGEEKLPDVDLPLGETPVYGPRTMALDGNGDLHLALREGNAIYRISPENEISRYAGIGKFGYRGDGGPALEGRLCGPKGLVVANGVSYFADTESHTIRAVLADGTLSTVVGDGEVGDGPDGEANGCRLARPHGVCVDTQGNLYIGDSENHRIRVVRFEE